MNNDQKLGGDRPVEITPEMIRAGREALAEYEWGWGNPSETVTTLFLAMEAARHQQNLE